MLHHLDLYRLGPSADIRLLDIDEMLDSGGVVVVEWGEHAGRERDAPASLSIDIDDDGSRVISQPAGAPPRLLDAWQTEAGTVSVLAIDTVVAIAGCCGASRRLRVGCSNRR